MNLNTFILFQIIDQGRDLGQPKTFKTFKKNEVEAPYAMQGVGAPFIDGITREIRNNDDSFVAMLMEHLGGPTIKELIKEGKISKPRCIRLFGQLLCNLARAFQLGYSHEDIHRKCWNLFFFSFFFLFFSSPIRQGINSLQIIVLLHKKSVWYQTFLLGIFRDQRCLEEGKKMTNLGTFRYSLSMPPFTPE